MTPQALRRTLIAGTLLAGATARAQEAPVQIPPPMPPTTLLEVDEAEPPVVRPAPIPVEGPPYELPELLPGKAPLDPVATSQRGPHFIRKKIRSWHWRRIQGKLFGYPEEFKPRPLGSSVYAMGRTMVSNGAEAGLTLYDYDFVPDSPELTDRGRDQLARAAAQLAASPFPLIVERTPDDPALAENRRRAVAEILASAPTPVGPERVLVGQPAAFGMSGNDARLVGVNALGRTEGYGPPIPLNSNGINSASGVTKQGAGQ